MGSLLFFTRGSWAFENYKIQSLWRDLSGTDKEIFGFHMAAYDWKDILCTHLDGMRLHILKEELTPQNLEKAARKIKMLVNFFYFTPVRTIIQISSLISYRKNFLLRCTIIFLPEYIIVRS